MNLPNTQKEVTVSVELKPWEELQLQCSCSQCSSITCFAKRHAAETCRNCEVSKTSLFFSAKSNITPGKIETLNDINDNVGKEFIEKQIIYEYDKDKDITRIINKQSRVFTYRTDSKHKFDEKTECFENPLIEYRSINDTNSRKNDIDEKTMEFNKIPPNVDQSIAVPISPKTDKGEKTIEYVGIPPNVYQSIIAPISQKNCVCPSLVEHNEISPNERITFPDIQKKCVCASAVKCNGIAPNEYQSNTVPIALKGDKDKKTTEHVEIPTNEYQSMTVPKSQKNCVCPSLVEHNEISPNKNQPIAVPDIQKKGVCASAVECNGITPNEYQSITGSSSRKDDNDKKTIKYVGIPPNEYQRITVPNSQNNCVCSSAGELKAQIMDVPYKQFEQSLSRQKPETVTNLASISPYDIFKKIKEVYNACSCKVCQCIVGKSLKNELCKCKPCECDDCTSFIKKMKSETKSNERVRTRIGKKSKYCDCEPCACNICCTDSISKSCNCVPCQCVECKSMVIKRRTMVIAPVGEGYRNDRHGCDCSPCQCIECRHGYSVPLNVTRHEISTGVSRHPQCQCEACDNDACLPDGTNTCLCVRPDRVMRKPVQRDNDFDIRTAVLTPSCICRRGDYSKKHAHDTIAMFAAVTDNYPEYLTKKNQCSCSQCECITCSYKEDIVNAVKLSSKFETNACVHDLNNNEKNCKCSLCECQFCTYYEHKKLENCNSIYNFVNQPECNERVYLDCTKINKSQRTVNSKTVNHLASFSKCRCSTCECTKCEKIMPKCTGDICNCLNCRCESCIAKANLGDVAYPVKKGKLLISTIYQHKENESFLNFYGNRVSDEKNLIGVSHNAPKNVNERIKFRNVPVDDYQKCDFQINEISRQRSHRAVKTKIETSKSGHPIPSNVSNAFLTKDAVDYQVSLSNISANSSAFYSKDSESISPVSGLPNKSWESSLNSSGYDYPNYLVQSHKSTAETCLYDVLKFNLDSKTLDAIKPSSKVNFARKPFKNATVFNDYHKNVNSDYVYMPVSERTIKTVRKQDILKPSYDECSFVDKKKLSPEQVNVVSPYRNVVATQTENKNRRWFQRKYNEYTENARTDTLCTGKSLVCTSSDNNADLYTLEEDYERVQKTLLEARVFSQQLAEILVKYEKANREFESVSQKLKFVNNVAENILTSFSDDCSNTFINGGKKLPKDDDGCPCIRCNRGSCKGINKNSPEPCQCVQSECKISNKSYSKLNTTGLEVNDVPTKEQTYVQEKEITHTVNNYSDNEENRIDNLMAKLTLDAESINALKDSNKTKYLLSTVESSHEKMRKIQIWNSNDSNLKCGDEHEDCNINSTENITNTNNYKMFLNPVVDKNETINVYANNVAENILTSFSDEVSSNTFINGGKELPKDDLGCPCIRCNRGSCKGINKNSPEPCQCVQSECKISNKSYNKLNTTGSEVNYVPTKEQKYVQEEEITHTDNNYSDNEENRIGNLMAKLTLDAESVNTLKNSKKTKYLVSTVKSSHEKMREIQICDSNDSNLKCGDVYEDCNINSTENITNTNNYKMFLNPVVDENETINNHIGGAKKQRSKTKKLNKFNKMYKRSNIVLSKGIKINAPNINEKIVASVETETSNTLIFKLINDKKEGDIQIIGYKQTMDKNVTEKDRIADHNSTSQKAIKTKLTLLMKTPREREGVRYNEKSQQLAVLKKHFCIQSKSPKEVLCENYPMELKIKEAVRSIILEAINNNTEINVNRRENKSLGNNRKFNTVSSQVSHEANNIYSKEVYRKDETEIKRSDINCDSLKVKLLTAQGVSDHTVLMKWNAPKNLKNVVGYELLIDGRAVQKIVSPTRCVAIATCLPSRDKILFTVRTVTSVPCPSGHMPATTVIYRRTNK